jgi:predicted metalloprotease
MRWKGREQSKNVEDRRGITPAMAVGGGGILMMLIVGLAFLFDPRLGQQLLQQQQQQQAQAQKQVPAGQARKPGEPDNEGDFIKVVLRDTETVWTRLFKEGVQGGTYQPPQLVMFSGSVQSRCGMATADVGPFYCPGDQKVYIDPTFFTELEKRHKAGGEFARAYVIAHEVAHHVQKLIGFSDQPSLGPARVAG